MLHLWDTNMDILSAMMVVMAIGVCVDYSAHIAHTFRILRGSKLERAKNCLIKMGPPVLNGGITTMIAILPLVFSTHYSFKTFFKVTILCYVITVYMIDPPTRPRPNRWSLFLHVVSVRPCVKIRTTKWL